MALLGHLFDGSAGTFVWWLCWDICLMVLLGHLFDGSAGTFVWWLCWDICLMVLLGHLFDGSARTLFDGSAGTFVWWFCWDICLMVLLGHLFDGSTGTFVWWFCWDTVWDFLLGHLFDSFCLGYLYDSSAEKHGRVSAAQRFFFWKGGRGMLVLGTSLTNGLIQTDHDIKKSWGRKGWEKKSLRFCFNSWNKSSFYWAIYGIVSAGIFVW